MSKHPTVRWYGLDYIQAVEDHAASGGVSAQNVAQHLAMAAAHIDDEARGGEIIGSRHGGRDAYRESLP